MYGFEVHANLEETDCGDDEARCDFETEAALPRLLDEQTQGPGSSDGFDI